MVLDALAGNHSLKNALPGPDRLPHALLICGPAGSGRHTLAGLLAQALVCDRPEIAPCGQCLNCRRAAEGIHPDVPALSAFTGERDREKRFIGVDTVRALRTDAFVRPNQARRKVYTIDPAERMNPNAQNALLKVLEDGPPYVSFLLIAENPMALLPTIRSRCVTLKLTPVETQEAAAYLARRFPDRARQALLDAAQRSRGILGEAVRILEGGDTPDETVERCARELWAALEGDSPLALMEWAVAVQNDKLTRDQLREVYQRLRAMALDVLTGRNPACTLDRALLCNLADLTAQGMEAMDRNVNPAISGAWFAVKLEESKQ